MKFLVRFDDGNVTIFEAETFSEEGALTYFYDEDDKLVGAFVTAKAFAIEKLREGE